MGVAPVAAAGSGTSPAIQVAMLRQMAVLAVAFQAARMAAGVAGATTSLLRAEGVAASPSGVGQLLDIGA